MRVREATIRSRRLSADGRGGRDRATTAGHHRRVAGAGDRGAVRQPPPGGPRGPRDQARATGRRRLRPRLRRAGRGAELPLRVDQPEQGVADPRHQGPARPRRRAAAAGLGGRVPAEPRARRDRPGRARCGGAAARQPRADRVRHLRLRGGRSVRVDEGVRPDGAGRGRAALGHRHRPTTSPRSASRSPTSPRGCTRTARSSRRCSSAAGPAAGRTSTSRCWRRRWSGWGSRSTTPTTAPSRPRGRAPRTRRSTRTGRSPPATAWS